VKRPVLLGVAGLACVAMAACGSTTSSSTAAPTSTAPSATPGQQIVVQLTDATGAEVAVVTLTPASGTTTSASGTTSPSAATPTPTPVAVSPSGSSPGTTPVHFHVEVMNLGPGGHGFAIHAVGKCDPPSFATAGPIFDVNSAAHGFLNPRGPKSGDLPDLGVGTDHTATFDFVDNLVTLDPNAPNSLVSAVNGTSLVITRDPDDQRSQPNGGPRIACGVIAAGGPSPSASATAPGTQTVTPVTARPSTATPLPTQSAAPSPSYSGGTVTP
jgi:Cu-Zn family superoxide dismutase